MIKMVMIRFLDSFAMIAEVLNCFALSSRVLADEENIEGENVRARPRHQQDVS